MSETWMIAGAWLSAGLTIAIFSFLYEDNPFFKIAEHLYLGAGMGWLFQVSVFSVWGPKIWTPISNGDYMVIVPSLLGLSLLTQFVPKLSWVSRYGFTFIMGYGAGLAIPATLSTDFMNQILGTIRTLSAIASMGPLAIFNVLLVAFGVVCVLFYFFFSVEHKGHFKKVSNIGIYFLMIYFGAAFGNTVMARFSLLYGRFDDLYSASTARNFYATQAILAVMVLYFVIDHFRKRKPPVEEEAA